MERSFIQSRVVKAELLDYLKISISEVLNPAPKEILVFPNMEYQFTFFDVNIGSKRTITGLVTKVYEDQIRVKYIEDKNDTVDCSNCGNKACKNNTTNNKNNTVSPMPSCNCILNPDASRVAKYEDPKIFFIPIQNIIDARYIRNASDATENNNEGEIKVMLLGISATMAKAIIIRLEFFDDQIEEAVKYVDLKADNIYDIAYETNDGTIYETRAKVIKIEEVDDVHPGTSCRGFVREHVGVHSSSYTSCACTNNSKVDFIGDPPVSKVRIIVDTSEDLHGRYESIMLHAIRDCKLVTDAGVDDPFIEYDCCNKCIHKTETCDPNNCQYCLPPKKPTNNGCNCVGDAVTFTYSFDNKYKVDVTGEKIIVNVRGVEKETSLEEIVKFYLGVD